MVCVPGIPSSTFGRLWLKRKHLLDLDEEFYLEYAEEVAFLAFCEDFNQVKPR